jgi:hypothetical protein
MLSCLDLEVADKSLAISFVCSVDSEDKQIIWLMALNSHSYLHQFDYLLVGPRTDARSEVGN